MQGSLGTSLKYPCCKATSCILVHQYHALPRHLRLARGIVVHTLLFQPFSCKLLQLPRNEHRQPWDRTVQKMIKKTNYDRTMTEHSFSGQVHAPIHCTRLQNLTELTITWGSSSIGSSSFQLQVRCSSCSCERPLFKMTSLSEETAMMLRTSWQEVQHLTTQYNSSGSVSSELQTSR